MTERSFTRYESTGLTKSFYLDIMEKAVHAYDKRELENELPPDGQTPLKDIHWYGRITAIIGILIARGRLREYLGLWLKMTEACVNHFTLAKDDTLSDFTVKEIMLCLMEIKNMDASVVKEDGIGSEGASPADIKAGLARWLPRLSRINPQTLYHFVPGRIPDEHLHNINVYNMAGEWLREKMGLGSTADYLNTCFPIQLERFDENGMYRDPNCPMLYDVTTRCQFQIMLHYGYQGEYAGVLDGYLKKSALITLQNQSTGFELPYGGRSNQFLFNEALLAANFEYEASRYAREKNWPQAEKFKRGARLAALTVTRWLNSESCQSIKNFYSPHTLHGCESYGYYKKYMITLGCFIYLAYLFADDTVGERPCPAETGGFFWQSPPHFHKIMANSGGVFVEVDTKADTHYDANGLGRCHMAGVPTEYILSMPFASEPHYTNCYGQAIKAASLSTGFRKKDGSPVFLSELQVERHELITETVSEKLVSFRVNWYFKSIDGIGCVSERIELGQLESGHRGLRLTGSLPEDPSREVLVQVPVFRFNGREQGQLTVTPLEKGSRAENVINGFRVIYESNGSAAEEPSLLANRNGEYALLLFSAAEGPVYVRIEAKEGESLN